MHTTPATQSQTHGMHPYTNTKVLQQTITNEPTDPAIPNFLLIIKVRFELSGTSLLNILQDWNKQERQVITWS